jgi:hypothetical protein
MEIQRLIFFVNKGIMRAIFERDITYLKEIDPRPADHPEIINYIRGVLKEGLCEIETGT